MYTYFRALAGRLVSQDVSRLSKIYKPTRVRLSSSFQTFDDLKTLGSNEILP